MPRVACLFTSALPQVDFNRRTKEYDNTELYLEIGSIEFLKEKSIQISQSGQVGNA